MNGDRVRALGGDSLVRVGRRCGDELRGLVAGVGRKWMLLHLVWDLDPAGLVAVRLSDIRRAEADHSGDDVAVCSLRSRGLLPRPVTDVRLDRTSELLLDMQLRGGSVTIHPERRWPGTCHLGLVICVHADRKRFSLLEVSPAAKWDDAPTEWRFRDVRRVDIADAYAAAIVSLAGPAPSAIAETPQR